MLTDARSTTITIYGTIRNSIILQRGMLVCCLGSNKLYKFIFVIYNCNKSPHEFLDFCKRLDRIWLAEKYNVSNTLEFMELIEVIFLSIGVKEFVRKTISPKSSAQM